MIEAMDHLYKQPEHRLQSPASRHKLVRCPGNKKYIYSKRQKCKQIAIDYLSKSKQNVECKQTADICKGNRKRKTRSAI